MEMSEKTNEWDADRRACEAFINGPWTIGDATDMAENLPARMIAALERIAELEVVNARLKTENARLRRSQCTGEICAGYP
jgi:hypothetical protein